MKLWRKSFEGDREAPAQKYKCANNAVIANQLNLSGMGIPSKCQNTFRRSAKPTLCKRGAKGSPKTLVYTGKDKKTGEPANPVEVTTGLSDGENVEILSGIDSGTTVYYLYYDTVTESDAVETERSMF